MTVHYHLHDTVPIDKQKTLLLAYKAMNYHPLSNEFYYRRGAGWQMSVKDVDRGFCNNAENLIIIPLWAFKHKNTEFSIYYLAHELAHIETDTDTEPHGAQWRAKFMQLCPKNLVKFDLNYRLGGSYHVY